VSLLIPTVLLDVQRTRICCQSYTWLPRCCAGPPEVRRNTPARSFVVAHTYADVKRNLIGQPNASLGSPKGSPRAWPLRANPWAYETHEIMRSVRLWDPWACNSGQQHQAVVRYGGGRKYCHCRSRSARPSSPSPISRRPATSEPSAVRNAVRGRAGFFRRATRGTCDGREGRGW